MQSTEATQQAILIEKCPKLATLPSGKFKDTTEYLNYIINEYTKCALKQNSRTTS